MIIFEVVVFGVVVVVKLICLTKDQTKVMNDKCCGGGSVVVGATSTSSIRC